MKLIYSPQSVKISDELTAESQTCMWIELIETFTLTKDTMWTLYLSVFYLSVLQVEQVLSTGCDIASLSSPSAATLDVAWSSYSGATYYQLSLKVVNSTTVAPVVVQVPSYETQKNIQGLTPGSLYEVTLKVFVFMNSVCTDVETTMTVPDRPQITLDEAISSTSVAFEWTNVTGAASYQLFVEEFNSQAATYTKIFTTWKGEMDGLEPSTTYDCYIIAHNSAGSSESSFTRTVTTLVQPPAVVGVTSTGRETAEVTWTSVSDVLLYQVTVTDKDNPSNTPVVRNTSGTSMDISNLEPCSTYAVGVSSKNAFMVPGEPTIFLYTTSTIQSVTTISVDYSCSSSMVTVTWGLVFGANSYMATAVDGTGASLNCTSTSSSCQIFMLSCGEQYQVRVTVFSDDCNSTSTTTTPFETVPCAPLNIQTVHTCSSNVIIFSWDHTNKTTHYKASSVDSNGIKSTCITTDNNCYFTNAACGQFYTFTVFAVSTECNSDVSQPKTVQTAPCLPTNVDTAGQCLSDKLVMIWDSAVGADSYTIEILGNTEETYNCTTNSSSCEVIGVPCGEHLSIWITASNEMCTTPEVLGKVVQTVPCPPKNVSALVDCSQDSARVNWTTSIGAIFYIVIAKDSDGKIHTCFSMGSNCLISTLTCGKNYTVTVIATNIQCNTSHNEEFTFMTGPCPPTNIQAVRSCDDNFALIEWQNYQPTGLYTATMKDQSGAQLTCSNDTANFCTINSPPCGKRYNVTVTYSVGSCVSTSTSISMDSVPCSPEDVIANVACDTGDLTLTWNISVPADNFTAVITGETGQSLQCNSTGRNCTMGGLLCGNSYNVTVSSTTGMCSSLPSTEVTVQTLPCPPTNVAVNKTCSSAPVPVSWATSGSAEYYTAVATSSAGNRTVCSTNQDSCSLVGLHCGEVYTIGVSSADDNCTSQLSNTVSLNTAPCLPEDIVAVANCDSDGAATVSWSTVSGAANFSLTAFVSGGLQTLCTTQQNSCNVTNLTCGETYNVSVTASNNECSVTAMMPTNITTGPCPPQGVAVALECALSTAVLSWVAESDVELYKATAIKASGGEVKKCNSTGSTCDFPGLVCGETYNFTVTALSQGCCSQPSSTVSIQTEPCQPVITSVQTLCQSEQVQISWNQTSGVMNYSLTVRGNLGCVYVYNTTDPLLSVTLQCGQSYNVTVQGQGYECESIPSSPAFFKMGPCIPQNVTTCVHCELDTASVSWGSSYGAEKYVAVATGLDGHNHQCLSNTTSCTWNDLHCGENYTVVVTAKDDSCTSLPSSSSVIYMDPCVPENLAVSVDCNTKVVSLIWDASNGSETYYVTAEAENTTDQLMTNVTTVDFINLACGQHYNLSVTPHSSHCAGSSSELASIQTWPCPPSGISVAHNCHSGIALVSWQASTGSDSYTLSVQSDDGILNTATSVVNHVNVSGLDCGYNFSLSATASNQQCNATSSENAFLQSVPCVPTNVTVVMDCANNSALVSWSASRGAEQYSVTAHSSACNSTTSCQTSNLNYSLNNLTCGSSYTIQVLAMDNTCSSVPSLAVVLDSAPCPPQNVSVQFNCSSNDMTISWDAVGYADHFLVSATADSGGISESRNTTNAWCSFSNVTCGKTFNVHVTSVRGNCHSQRSQTHSILSAPCQPQGISGSIDCVTNSAWITWSAALGADSYAVSAVGTESYAANCTTSSNTTCEVEDLACGAHYNFSVTAKNSQCESQPSATVDLDTAPCSLSAITALSRCHNSSILVMWELMEGSAGNIIYTVTARASDNSSLTCNNTGSSCYLHGAQCDLRYAIIVAASSDQCSSMRSPTYKINMEPCPPQDVMLNSSCEDQSVVVSWTPSSVAETYNVVAMAAGGHVHSYNTTSSNCSMSDLHCDQQYTIFVTASYENCSSEASQNATLNTGPCQPSGVSVAFDCNNKSAELTWTPSMSALEYYGCAQSENGDILCSYSTSFSCTIEGLDCGTLYNFSVQASDGTCNSSVSDPVQQGAVPCPPDDVEVQLMPMQLLNQVMRFSWTEVSCVTSGYLVTISGNLLGDSQALFELSFDWTNSLYFEFPLPCGSAYNATLQSRNSAGTSDPSEALGGLTAPCPPTGQYITSGSLTTISWGASAFASEYTVYDKSVTPKTQLCRVTVLSCSLPNINTSQLVITASNAAGESEEAGVYAAGP